MLRLGQPMQLLGERRVLVVSELELQSKPKGQCMQLSGWSICRGVFWTWTCEISNQSYSNNDRHSKDCELGVITNFNA